MVKRTITITTILLIISIAISLIIVLNKSSFAAEDIASGTSGTCSWVIDSEGVLTIRPTDGVSGTLRLTGNGIWYDWREQITKVVIEQGVKATGNMYRLFAFLPKCTEMDLLELDTSEVTNMAGFFTGCSNLMSLDLSNFDTSKVTRMDDMFNSCSNMTTIDLSSFDTSKVTNMESMFSSCSSLISLDLSGFNTINVTNMHFMFRNCSNLINLDVSGLNTSNVTVMSQMFDSCSKLTSLDVSGFDTHNVYAMAGMFAHCNNIITLDVSGFDTSNVKGMGGMFEGCSSLTELDVSGFDTSKITSLYFMFEDCSSLTELDVSGFNTSNVTDMRSTFSGCSSLIGLDVSGFDTSNVTTMNWLFCGCKNLTYLDVTNFDTSKVTDMACMFENCKSVSYLDVAGFDTSNVTTMANMFCGCSKVTSLDISNFDTSKVKNMGYMFLGCSQISSLDLSNFDCSSLIEMYGLFENCTNIKTINVSTLDTSKVKDMSELFRGCTSLEYLDLSSFNTSQATRLHYMFVNCSSLKEITFGNNFGFKGNNTGTIYQAILYTPPTTSPYTGKWIKKKDMSGIDLINQTSMTPTEIKELTGEDLAGTWIWEEVTPDYNVTYSFIGDVPDNASTLPEVETHIEGELVTVAPNATALGYDFNGWSRTGTFAMPAENVEITGSFTPRTDTPYKVEYYLEDLKADTYTLKKTDNLTGTTDTEVTAEEREYEGFTFDSSISGTKLSGNIAGDGSLVLKLYYKRNSYNVTYSYTGDIPDDASDLPQQETYEYEEELNVPEEATADGYTFSGWIKDYINMPAKDIEITGYFIENPKSYRYKVEYFFDGELDDTLDEILNAEEDEKISITPQTPVKHGDKNYTLVSNNHQITISINNEDNVIRVYYEADELDYAIDSDTTEGDGIPDKYQISITYKVENGNWNDGSKGTKTDIITLKDKDGNLSEDGTGTTTIPEVGSKPSEGYEVGSWNEEIPTEVSNKNNGKEFVYSYKKSEKQNVEQKDTDITEASGKIYNPKTDDIVNKYLLVGIGGILVLALVSKIRRKYSRKAKKIQY